MGRMKLGIAVAGVVLTLLGVVAFAMTRSDGSTNHATSVASGVSTDATAPVATTPAAATPATQPAVATTAPSAKSTPATTKAPATKPAPSVTVPAQPTPQDIQKVIAGITAEVLAPADTTASTKPLTKEEVEAKLREQLKQLGITY